MSLDSYEDGSLNVDTAGFECFGKQPRIMGSILSSLAIEKLAIMSRQVTNHHFPRRFQRTKNRFAVHETLYERCSDYLVAHALGSGLRWSKQYRGIMS